MKILLVEDSRSLRLENERALQRAGYDVICAEDEEEALQRACEEFPDVILLDLLLPRISGLEVLRRLRRMAETAEIPVVVVSGLSGKNRAQLKASTITSKKMPSCPTRECICCPRFWKMWCAGLAASTAKTSSRHRL